MACVLVIEETIMKKALLSLLVICSLALFSFDQSDDLASSVARGKSVYETYCTSCHMAEGEGVEGVFPPLARTGRLADKATLVKAVLQGISGPITVSGKSYDMEMAPIALSDEETRDVLNYVRNSWGNKGPVVTLDEVKKLKAGK